MASGKSANCAIFDANHPNWKEADYRPTNEIPHPYQQIFQKYPHFNLIQSKVLDDVLYTDSSLVISAPTGSGKTAIFELAIVRLLLARNNAKHFKIVYVSPMKALCEERLADWHGKFGQFGLNCILATGDSNIVSMNSLGDYNLIITTPEKWDSLTRRWKEYRTFVQTIKLFLIDEIHLLEQDKRGSTLETIVGRMKTIEETAENGNNIRFMALSATLANIEDIAEWIGKFTAIKYYKFANNCRPVKLNKVVIGYAYNPTLTPFKFEMFLNYKLPQLLIQHSNRKPTLIFCSTRKMVELTANFLLQNLTLTLNPEHKKQLAAEAAKICDNSILKSLITNGIAYHHAGLLAENRRIIENLFRGGKLSILVTTRTLAMGINLPAHLVVIKSTKYYANGEYKDYSEIDLLQMMGRAGRPQFDSSGTALILTNSVDKEKYEKMVGVLKPIESNLHKHLCEHLNVEIVLGTITDLNVAMQWISNTFLYVRAKKNPKYYGINSVDANEIDQKLLEMCRNELNKLLEAQFIKIDDGDNSENSMGLAVEPTTNGVLMAKYCLAFDTMKLFMEMNGHEVLQQILALISACKEFNDMFLRVNDKKPLNLLNKSKNSATVRFPLNGPIKTLPMKINCVIQATLGCMPIQNHSLMVETYQIMSNAERIAQCLIKYLQSKTNYFRALLNAIIMQKCLNVKLWENSPYVSRQLNRIGLVYSTKFVDAGKTTFESIKNCGAREIESILGKKPPTGSHILEQINGLPKYSVKLMRDGKDLTIGLRLENHLDLVGNLTVKSEAKMQLLVGDSENKLILFEKYTHSYMIENPDVRKTVTNAVEDGLEAVEAHFISEDWVGIDCSDRIELNKTMVEEVPRQKEEISTNQAQPVSFKQTFMDMYLKIKGKKSPKPKVSEKKAEKKKVTQDVAVVKKSNDSFCIEEDKTQQENLEIRFLEKKSSSNNTQSSFDNINELLESIEEEQFENATAETNCLKNEDKNDEIYQSIKIVEILEPESKKNCSKITWRSPIALPTPPRKYSPKMNNFRIKSEVKSQTLSKANFVNNIKSKISPVLSRNEVFFGLTDDECIKQAREEEFNEELQKLEAFVDLESFGLKENKCNVKKMKFTPKIKISPKENLKVVSKSELKNANYYHSQPQQIVNDLSSRQRAIQRKYNEHRMTHENYAKINNSQELIALKITPIKRNVSQSTESRNRFESYRFENSQKPKLSQDPRLNQNYWNFKNVNRDNVLAQIDNNANFTQRVMLPYQNSPFFVPQQSSSGFFQQTPIFSQPISEMNNFASSSFVADSGFAEFSMGSSRNNYLPYGMQEAVTRSNVADYLTALQHIADAKENRNDVRNSYDEMYENEFGGQMEYSDEYDQFESDLHQNDFYYPEEPY